MSLEQDILLAHVLKKPRSYILAHRDEPLTPVLQIQFDELWNRFQQGEPIAYLIGHKEFWSLDLIVNEHVLIPRPETELLVELVLKHTEEKVRIADLGTGSGAIALALARERPHWEIYATDQSQEALNVAKQNAEHLSLSNIQFLLSHWCEALPKFFFDIIVSNPPYIAEGDSHLKDLRYEPQAALVSGRKGLDAMAEIIPSAIHYLKPGGMLFIEHGYNQGSAVTHLFKSCGYNHIQTHKDYAGLDRVTSGIITL